MFYEGINALTGIIPVPDKYDIIHNAKNISKVFVIDHYQNPKKSGPSKGRAYHPPAIPVVGSLYRKETFPGISYTNIGLSEKIQDGITAEITPRMDVTLNGVIIASAPKFTTTKTGKEKARTQAQKLRFCKAVIWGLMDDENALKDKLSEIGYRVPAHESDPVDQLVENITMSPYPGPAIVEEIEYTEAYEYRQKIRDDMNTIIINFDDDPEESPYEITGAYLNPENNLESPEEIINAFCTIPAAGTYYPHLRVYIQEVPA